MNPQEQQVLRDFLQQLVQVRGLIKDHEADEMIETALAQQPDAAYLLVQRALLLEQALNHAKAEINTLQSRVRRGNRPSSSFLDADTWGNDGAQRPAPASAPAAPYGSPSYQTPPRGMEHRSGPGFLRGGMGGMGGLLGAAAATAAGVAGGAFLFQGIGNLLENRHEGSQHEGKGLLGQSDDASDAFPGLTRPGQYESALDSDTSSGFVDDQGGDFFDDVGGDDSLFT